MPDCFISYSSDDERLGRFVGSLLISQGVSVFMVSVSLQPGQNWSQEISRNLRESSWVIFLASRSACRSAYVQQELGGALFSDKRLVPIVWDMSPIELPGWVNQKHALDLRGRTLQDLATEINRIASLIKADNTKGALIAGGVILGLLWLASQAIVSRAGE